MAKPDSKHPDRVPMYDPWDDEKWVGFWGTLWIACACLLGWAIGRLFF